MRPLQRPLAALFALAYLSAGWLASALHSHAGHAHIVEPAKAGCEVSHGCGHDHSHHHGHKHCSGHDDDCDPNSRSGEPSDTPCEHDEQHHCVVCEFQAKPPLLVEPLSLPATTLPVLPAVEPALPTAPAAVATACRNRGPPVA